MTDESAYKIVFQNQGQVVELYARHVSQGVLFGFIEVEGLIFGARSQVVLDPTEEGLRNEYGAARRLYLPLHAVLRVEEVEHAGQSRVTEAGESGGAVRPFPLPASAPGGKSPSE